MKVCVYGAGAIGGSLAVYLGQAGCDLSVVARSAHLEAIREHGLTLEAGERVFTVHPRATDRPEELGPQELVVVAVKTPALAAIAEGIGNLLGPRTGVAFCINGLPWWYLSRLNDLTDLWSPAVAGMVRALETHVGRHRAIGGIAYSANDVPAPGRVRVANPDSCRYLLAEAQPDAADACEQLVALLNAGGGRAEHSTDFESEIWKKLSVNCVSGPIGALTGMTTRALLAHKALRPLVSEIWSELGAVAAAIGQPGALADLDAIMRIASDHKSSMLQDFEKGRPPEIETLLGATCDLARLRGIPVPGLNMLLALTRGKAEAADLFAAHPLVQ